jgi:hypothetical protein
MTHNFAIARARRQASKLLAAVAPHFPLDVPSTGRHDDWAVTGPAFVARSMRLIEAVLALPNAHESAAGVLARVLYEHVTTFAWIAIDPPKNAPVWISKDRDERLKVDNDTALFGERPLEPEHRAAYELERDAAEKWPGLPVMASQADDHWAPRIPGFATDKNGLRKTYIAVYRQFSTLVHGMAESLHRVVADGPRPGMSRVTVVEETPEEHNAFTATPYVFAFGLLISSETNGFPTKERVYRAFQ